MITPTISRPTLKRALLSARLTPEDEWLVIGDGPQPEAERMVRDLAVIPYLRYLEGPFSQNWGCEQRDLAMSVSDRDYFLFLDDDDVFVPRAIDIVRYHLEALAPRPMIFRMYHNGRVRWESREMFPGNICTSMFCLPNAPDKLGRWSNGGGYSSDLRFIQDTLACYDQSEVIWSGDVIVRARPGEEPGSGRQH